MRINRAMLAGFLFSLVTIVIQRLLPLPAQPPLIGLATFIVGMSLGRWPWVNVASLSLVVMLFVGVMTFVF